MNASGAVHNEGIPLFWWGENLEINFGDYLSLKLVERIVDRPIPFFKKKPKTHEKKLLAIGSIFYFAYDGDVIWDSGINGKTLDAKYYEFKNLDIRSVRGPLTRKFLMEQMGIECPEIYGDPALLFPYFFPEFERKKNPRYDYIVIPHFSEIALFPKENNPHIVYPTDPWYEVIDKILDSKFVISSSLHGIILAEAYGIPARMLRVSENQGLFKYCDYYQGTGRNTFQYATSIEEALLVGGEPPFICDLEKLYFTFPFEFWPTANYKFPKLSASSP